MASMIEAIEIKRKMYFEYENAPYHCLDVEVSKPTARGGQTLVRIKMRNLLTRAVFDKMLIEHAAEQGAQVHQGVAVKQALFEGDKAVGVEVQMKDGSRQSFNVHWAAICLKSSSAESIVRS